MNILYCGSIDGNTGLTSWAAGIDPAWNGEARTRLDVKQCNTIYNFTIRFPPLFASSPPRWSGPERRKIHVCPILCLTGRAARPAKVDSVGAGESFVRVETESHGWGKGERSEHLDSGPNSVQQSDISKSEASEGRGGVKALEQVGTRWVEDEAVVE